MKTFEGLYLKKDYPNALLELEKHKQDVDAGLWHYNMGTVEGQLKNWPSARYHFLLSDMSGLRNSELSQNLELAESQLGVVRLEQALNTSDYLIKGSLFVSQGPLLSLSLLFLVIGLCILKKQSSFKKMMLVLFFVALPLTLNFWIKSWPRKIVTSAKPIYEGPAAMFGTRGEVPAGVMVLTKVKDGWEEIVYPSRFSGWIKSDGLKRLELK